MDNDAVVNVTKRQLVYWTRESKDLPYLSMQTAPGIDRQLMSSSPHDQSLPHSPTEKEQKTAARAPQQAFQPQTNPVQAGEEKGEKRDVQTTYRERLGEDFRNDFARSADAIRDRLEPPSAVFVVGARVEIHSLLAAARAPELNGVHGVIVVPLDSSTGRWGVKTDTDSRVWSLRPDNLRRLEAHGHVYAQAHMLQERVWSLEKDLLECQQHLVSEDALLENIFFEEEVARITRELMEVKADYEAQKSTMQADCEAHARPASPGLVRIACTAYAARSPDELR
jgi:hypothetical protein